MPATQSLLKPQTPPVLLDLLVRVRQGGKVTAADVESTSIYLGRLQKDGLVRVCDKVRSGERGRPAHVYTVTDKGRKRAGRAMAKAGA